MNADTMSTDLGITYMCAKGMTSECALTTTQCFHTSTSSATKPGSYLVQLMDAVTHKRQSKLRNASKNL